MKKLLEINDLCWICNKNKADSAEHRFKRSDLKKRFAHKKNLIYIHGNFDKPKIIQSENSEYLTFRSPKVICKPCNNQVTQKADRAYEMFSNYIDKNFSILIESRVLDFTKIYPNNSLEGKRNLYRYFAKHAGCKIATWQYEVPRDIAQFVLGVSESVESLNFKFKLKESFYKLHEKIDFSHIQNGAVTRFGYESAPEMMFGWMSYQWITIYWCASQDINDYKRVDFCKSQEEIDIQFEKDTLIDISSPPKWINSIEYSGLESLEDKRKFAINMIE